MLSSKLGSEVELKIVLVGDAGVGKSTLCYKYLRGSYDPETAWLNKFSSEVTVLDSHESFQGELTVTLQNISGQEELDDSRVMSYRDAHVFLICFSLNDKVSLESVKKKWVPEIKKHCPNVPFLLVGTKSDARDTAAATSSSPMAAASSTKASPQRPKSSSPENVSASASGTGNNSKRSSRRLQPVSEEEGRSTARKTNAYLYVEVSASLGNHVELLFTEAVNAALTLREKRAAKVKARRGTVGMFQSALRPKATTKRLGERLAEAARDGQMDETIRLLRKGAKTTWMDLTTGRTALHEGAEAGRSEVVSTLLYSGANTEATDNNGRTALHLAANRGHLKVCEALLGRGAQVNSTDIVGNSPLHEAAVNGFEDIVKLLVSHSANPESKNTAGQTPQQRAEASGQFGLFGGPGNEE